MDKYELNFCDTPYFTMIQIIRQVYNVGKNVLEKNLAGISFDEFVVLDCVKSFPGEPQQFLCGLLLFDKGRLSKMLNQLEEKGLIVRKAGIEGKKLKKFIFISKKGSETLEKNKSLTKLFIEKHKEAIPKFDAEHINEKLKLLLKFISESSEALSK